MNSLFTWIDRLTSTIKNYHLFQILAYSQSHYCIEVIRWIRKPKPLTIIRPKYLSAHLRPAISDLVARCGMVASNLASIRARCSSTPS